MRLMIWALAAACSLVAGTASADWTVTVQEPNVFGNTKVLAGNGNDRRALIVWCDNDNLQIAFLEKKKEFAEIQQIHAKLLIQIDGVAPTTHDAITGSWNDNYGGVIVNGRNKEIVDVVRSISSAHHAINVGIISNEQKYSDSL
jgi:hypothetical protein